MVSFNTLFLVFTLDTTVAEANAVLADLDAEIVGGIPGVAGQLGGVLLLRLPTTTQEAMIAAIDSLRANPKVEIAVQDSLLETVEPVAGLPDGSARAIPNPNGGTPPGWTWEVAPSGGNWGMELIRAPQMWNLNPAVTKAGGSAVTGVHDSGFSTTHPDLTYLQNLSPFSSADHGTHVAGTIGATFNNGVGVDGVNPFAGLVVNRYGTALGWSFFDFLDNRTDLKVVNVSLGNNWYVKSPPINPNTSVAAQFLIKSQGQVFVRLQALRALHGQSLPFVFVAAGNDSGAALGNVEARWSSPLTYAALVLGAPNILVVEAVQQNAGGAGGPTRATFSNVRHTGALDAAVSAPGVAILSTAQTTPYQSLSGTSMATPHVTGLAGYLLSMEPTLTHAELRRLLLDNSMAVGGGASDRIDAFASALAIDGIRGNTDVLLKLIDVDDGSRDGNQRVLCATCPDFLEEDVDMDGGRGDGVVDMADFRRWRDWLLEVEAAPSLALDGSATHPKKDVNGDGAAATAVQENIYPQGDFNGDGILDRTTKNFVPGAVNALATDLDVLAKLFSDPYYTTGDLPSLRDSADLEVDAQTCLERENVAEVRSKVAISGTAIPVATRVHSDTVPRHIYTVAVNPAGYTVEVTAHDSGGVVLGYAQTQFPMALGSDTYFTPECGKIVLDREVVTVTLNVGETAEESVRLISDRMEAGYAVVNSIVHVTPAPTQGTVERDTEEEITLTFVCPDQPGVFPDDIELSFTDDRGQEIKVAVPTLIDVDLKCLPGGVLVSPDPVQLSAPIEQSVSSQFTLENLGTALNYQASAGGNVSLGASASGVLPEQGEVAVQLQATCPQTAGNYPSTITLSFSSPDSGNLPPDLPSGLTVNLTCTDDRPIAIYQQQHQAGVAFDYPGMSQAILYKSEDFLGTAYIQEQEIVSETVLITKTDISALGFSDVTISTQLAGSMTYNPWGEEHTRDVTGSADYTASFHYQDLVATFVATFNSSYSQSEPLLSPPYPTPDDGAGGSTNLTFDLKQSGTLSASWSCNDEFTDLSLFTPGIRLTRIREGAPNVLIFNSNTPGCTYSGSVAAGRYVFIANAGVGNRLDLTADVDSVSEAATYSMRITFAQ